MASRQQHYQLRNIGKEPAVLRSWRSHFSEVICVSRSAKQAREDRLILLVPIAWSNLAGERSDPLT